MATVHVVVNGIERALPAGASVADVVAQLPRTQGVAVAVDGEVLPRSAWAACALVGGERVEIVTAVQGG